MFQSIPPPPATWGYIEIGPLRDDARVSGRFDMICQLLNSLFPEVEEFDKSVLKLNGIEFVMETLKHENLGF